MVVGIVKSRIKNAKSKVRELIDLVGYKPSKRKLFLKPNIVSPEKPNSGAITHPAVVEGVIKAFSDSDYEIVIGEGNSYGTTKHTFDATGYGRLADEYGVELLDLDDGERYTVDWSFGQLELPAILKTHEYINVPTMKTHAQTLVTLAIKNQKGLLKLRTKRDFHMRYGLNEAIIELTKLVQPDFTVMDAIYCIEKSGPGSFFGKRKVMNLLVGGADFIEVDNACVAIMGHDISTIKHIPEVPFEIVGEPLEKVKADFIKTDPYWRILNLYFHAGLASCSGCTESVDNAFGVIKRSPWKLIKLGFMLMKRRDYLVGKDAVVPERYGELRCFGNCTKKVAKEHDLELIPGCPPSVEQIIEHFL